MKRIIKDTCQTEYLIENAYEDFLKSKQAEGRRPATISSYRRNIKPFLHFCSEFDICDVSDIDKAAIDDFKLYLINLDIEDGSKQSYIVHARAFLYWLMEDELIDGFKIKDFGCSSVDSVSVFTDDELKAFLNCSYEKSKHFSELRDYAILWTMLLTGLRRSSICEMRIGDLDFANGLISVRHIKRDKQYQIRQIPMSSDLALILKKYIRRTELKVATDADAYLFPNISAQKMCPDTINKRMKELAESVNVHWRGCHECRRTFISRTYNALSDIKLTQKLVLLGDSRVLDRYINVDLDRMKNASKNLNFASQISRKHILKSRS